VSATAEVIRGETAKGEMAGDLSAIFRTYAPDVFRFALYLSGNREEAEDITSETFVRAWSAPDRIEMATVKAYLFTIARNLFRMERRRSRKSGELDETLRDPQAGPGRIAEGRQELDAVLAALQQLPEIDRAALLMRAFEEMPYEEIARSLEISQGTAKVKVHRARLMLARVRSNEKEGL
jgi:RNA polymerase sigma-70 factor, ECF subfamily